MEDVIHSSHPDCCIIITLCDICCCMEWTSFDTFILFLKIIYYLKCAVFYGWSGGACKAPYAKNEKT